MMDCACEGEDGRVTGICGAHAEYTRDAVDHAINHARKQILDDLEKWIKDPSKPVLAEYGILYMISQLRNP